MSNRNALKRLIGRLADLGITGGVVMIAGLLCWSTVGREGAERERKIHDATVEQMQQTCELRVAQEQSNTQELERQIVLLRQQIEKRAKATRLICIEQFFSGSLPEKLLSVGGEIEGIQEDAQPTNKLPLGRPEASRVHR